MPRFGLQFIFAGIVAFAGAQLALAAEPPKFQIDTSWPKTLPNNWIIGQIGGIYVDSQDHIWIVHRPGTLTEREKRGAATPSVRCCVSAPPVIEFDQAGNVVQAWGGPGQGYEWPANEHGIFVDHNNFVWIGGNAEDKDGQVLKFSRDGKFVMQIGKAGPLTGSNDTTRLGRPADMIVDPVDNELYVADGYGNHRVIVFDAATGAYKRHWGAYGKPPTDMKMPVYKGNQELPQQFTNPVHCIRMSRDGQVHVCDRGHNRIQVFQKDGTYVKEFRVLPESVPGSTGSVMFWPDAQQSYMIVSDDPNGEFHIIRRSDGMRVGSAGRVGHFPGEFDNLHNLGIDSKGNIYTAEVQGKRVQRFRNVGGL